MNAARKTYCWTLLATVAVLLCLPLVALRNEAVSQRENRALAQRPEWDGRLSELPKFIVEWEAYFEDQYGFRREATAWSEDVWSWLGLGGPPKVIQGRDDWLFLGGGKRDSPLRDYAGANLFSIDELEAWRRRLERRRDIVRELGKEYLFLIAPNKMEIYPEYLPSKYTRRNGLTRSEQLVRHLREHSDVAALYLREALLQAKREDPPFPAYAKSGTHWNGYGAGLAQNAVAEWLAARFGDARPVFYEAADFKLGRIGVDVDLARMLGLEARYESLAPEPREPLPELSVEPVAGGDFGFAAGTVVEMVRYSNERDRRFLVFGDSFFRNLIPYMGHYFAEGLVGYVISDERTFRAAVERYPADVVIEQRVERYLADELQE